MSKPRKIIQISTATVVGDNISFGNNLATTALCNDGSVWEYLWPVNNGNGYWERFADIPQDNDCDDKKAVIENLRDAIQQAETYGLVYTEKGELVTGVTEVDNKIVLTNN